MPHIAKLARSFKGSGFKVRKKATKVRKIKRRKC